MHFGTWDRFGLGTRKASFAGATLTEEFTGMKVGGGGRSCKNILSPALLLRLPNVQVVEGLAVQPKP